MEPNYVQMFDIEFEDDNLRDGKLNIRNEFIRKVYLFYSLNLFSIMVLGLIPFYYFYSLIYFWGFLLLSQSLQFYFQYCGNLDLGDYRKILNYTLGSISIISNSFSYYYLIDLIDYQILIFDYGFFSNYYSFLIAFAEIFITGMILMLICNISESQLRNHETWIVALIIPYILQFIYNFFYLSLSNLTYPTAILTWIGVLVVMMTQEIKATNQDSNEAIFIHSCRLAGAPFQVYVYLIKFFSQSRRNDDLVQEQNAILKIQYLRRISIVLSIITFSILLIQFSVMYELIQGTELILPTLLVDYSGFTILYWVSIALSLILYPLIIILKRYHWSITWTLFVFQITFFTLVILGSTWYFTTLMNIGLIQISVCTFNGLFIGLVAYSFVEKKQFSILTAFGYSSICPVMIFIQELYLEVNDAIYYLYTFLILLGFLIYGLLLLVEIYFHLNHVFLKFKLQDYYIGAMLAYEPIFAMITRFFAIFFSQPIE